MRKIVCNKGISALEVIIASAIFTLILCATIALFFENEDLIMDAPYEIEALYKAHSNLELALRQGEINFENATSSTSTDSLYISTINVSKIDNYTKRIDSIVRYGEDESDDVTETAYLTDYNSAFGASSCDSSVSLHESWTHPSIFEGLDIGMGNSATALFVRKKIIFMTANAASSSQNDFYIIDASNPESLNIVSTLNTGPGLQAIAVAGNFAYVGNESINAQLQIIDIGNIKNPTLISSYKLPGKYTDGTTVAESIYYYKSRIYLGTKKSQIQEFHIIDVGDPYHPTELGSYEIGNAINKIIVSGNLAYIASPNNEELKILDISDPENIHEVGGYDAPLDSGNGESLWLSLDTLYLGRAVGNKELYILNVDNPTAPQAIASRQFGTSIYGIVIRGNLGFFATISAGKEFQILDMTNPQNMLQVATLSLGGRPVDLACDGNILYVALQGSDALRIISPQTI